MSQSITTRVKSWLTSVFDEDSTQTIKTLQENDIKTLEDSFYKDLEFGTGGMRGNRLTHKKIIELKNIHSVKTRKD
jgi:hypothetical protein